MKRSFIYAMMSAIALAGTAGFTSCAESEEVAEVNPGYNPETGEVPVQFVFNVATGNTATTRQSEADVQALATNTFRGMDQSALMSFKLASNGQHIYNVDDNTKADVLYALGPVLGAGSIGTTGTGESIKTTSHRVLELSVPTGTNALMFWGKALKDGTDHAEGKIEFSPNVNLAQSSFKLCPIVVDDTSDETKKDYGKSAFTQYQDLIIKILNKIVAAGITNQSVTHESTTKTVTMKWSNYVESETTDGTVTLKEKTTDPSDNSNNTSMKELGKILSNAYVLFNNISAKELRAGSGTSVRQMLSDLYTVIDKVATANPTDIEEEVAKQVGIAVKAVITDALNNSQTAWNELSTIKTKFELTDNDVNLIKGTSPLDNFPGNFGMPDGATILTNTITVENNNITVTYSYRDQIPTYEMGSGSEDFKIERYMYPAELCYFGNSPIRVTNDTHATADYPEGPSAWANEDSWKTTATDAHNNVDWNKNGVVLASTRSVAMQENINYGTALLKSTVRYGAATLKDNNSTLNGTNNANEVDKEITVTDNTFQLTGVLIGGQEAEMGWNYIAKATEPAFVHMIYDNALTDGSKTIPANTSLKSSPNYTLVWDNYNPKQGEQNTVYVALEFKNNSGVDFWGENNLIRQNAKFYITGKLDPANKTITWPAASGGEVSGNNLPYALPPYSNEGTTIQTPRVFIQDYMTTADFVIGENSLKHALVAVPDLRQAQISLGLSVDLNWSTGMSFENIVLGGEDTNSGNNEPGGGD